MGAWLNFKITKKSDAKIKQGTLIDYRLRIKGVPASWRTQISQWKPDESFMDQQLKGPYSRWDHTHSFQSLQNGTLMTDEVIYQVPLGPLGHIIREVVILNDIKTIFSFRNDKVREMFN